MSMLSFYKPQVNDIIISAIPQENKLILPALFPQICTNELGMSRYPLGVSVGCLEPINLDLKVHMALVNGTQALRVCD